jgi:RNA recognition motif-containing protein
MAKTLFVGGLSYNTTEDGLKAKFEEVGEVVSAKIIKDRETNRPRGFGFVEMASDEDAQKAIETLNQKEFDGRTIVVNEARAKS